MDDMLGFPSSAIRRDARNKHRYWVFVGGRIVSFLTHEKDALCNLAALFGQLNQRAMGVWSIRTTTAALMMALLGILAGQPAMALPTGWQVVNGDVTFVQDGSTLNITSNSQNAIVNYQSFNINAGEAVNFLLPGSTASILNRVIGGEGSLINGAMTGNGSVFLVNPAGIALGAMANVNVGSFVASTLNISDANYLAGQYTFDREGDPAGIRNEGNIEADGSIVLMGSAIQNSGTISAPTGHVELVVGDKVTVNMGNGLALAVTVDESLLEAAQGYEAAIQNSGTIEAHTAELEARLKENLYQHIVNNQGIIQAKNLDVQNGSIVVKGSTETGDGTVLNTGALDASGTATHADGGDILLSGDTLQQSGILRSEAGLGGTGGYIEVTSTGQTHLNANSLISASGGDGFGHAGEILIWSDGDTFFKPGAQLDVSGGALGGNAGFLEVSGKETVFFNGQAFGGALSGYERGYIFIDPTNITISNGGANTPTGNNANPTPDETFTDHSGTTQTFNPQAGGAFNGFGDIYLQATGDITVSSAFDTDTATGGSGVSLKLEANDDIFINAALTTHNADITLIADADNSGAGNITSNTSGIITSNGGNITMSGRAFSLAGAVNAGTGDIIIATGSTVHTFSGSMAADAITMTGNGGISTISGTWTATGDVNVTQRYINVASGANLNTPGNIHLEAVGEYFNNGLVLSSGSSITANSGTFLATGGHLIYSGATFNLPAASTLTLQSTGANRNVTISSALNWDKLQLLSAGAINVNANVTASDTLTFTSTSGSGTSSGNISAGTFNMTVGGGQTFNGSITANNLNVLGAGTLTYNGNLDIGAYADATGTPASQTQTGNTNFNGASMEIDALSILDVQTIVNGDITSNGNLSFNCWKFSMGSGGSITTTGDVTILGNEWFGTGVDLTSANITADDLSITSNLGNIILTGSVLDTNTTLIQADQLNKSITLNANTQIIADTTLNLTTTSTGADIITASSVTLQGGNITLSAANGTSSNITLGASNTITGNDITVTSGGTATIDSSLTANGTLTLTAGSTGFSTTQSSLSLTADNNADNSGNLVLNSAFSSGNGNLTLTGAQFDLNSTLSAGTGTVTVKPSLAKAITFGGATDNADDATYFDLSSAELGRITAGSLVIGNSALSGGLTQTGSVNVTGAGAGKYNLTLHNAGNIQTTGQTLTTTDKNLTMLSTGGTISTGNLSAVDLTLTTTGVGGGITVNDVSSSGNLTLQTYYGNITVNGNLTSSGGSGKTVNLIAGNDYASSNLVYTDNTAALNIAGTYSMTQHASKILRAMAAGGNWLGKVYSGSLNFNKVDLRTGGNNQGIDVAYDITGGTWPGVRLQTYGSNSPITQSGGTLTSQAIEIYANSSAGTALNPLNIVISASGGNFSPYVIGAGNNLYVNATGSNQIAIIPGSVNGTTGMNLGQVDGTFQMISQGSLSTGWNHSYGGVDWQTTANNSFIKSWGMTVGSGGINFSTHGTGIVDFGSGNTTSAGNVTITAGDISIGPPWGGTLNAGANTVTIKANGAKAIAIGDSADGNGNDATFDLNYAEMDLITAGTLVIGDTATAGGLTIQGDLNLTSLGYHLDLNNGGNITSVNNTFTLGAKTLDLVSLGNISVTTSSNSKPITLTDVTGVDVTLQTSGTGGAITVDDLTATGNVSLQTVNNTITTTTLSSNGGTSFVVNSGTAGASTGSLTLPNNASKSVSITAGSGTLMSTFLGSSRSFDDITLDAQGASLNFAANNLTAVDDLTLTTSGAGNIYGSGLLSAVDLSLTTGSGHATQSGASGGSALSTTTTTLTATSTSGTIKVSDSDGITLNASNVGTGVLEVTAGGVGTLTVGGALQGDDITLTAGAGGISFAANNLTAVDDLSLITSGAGNISGSGTLSATDLVLTTGSGHATQSGASGGSALNTATTHLTATSASGTMKVSDTNSLTLQASNVGTGTLNATAGTTLTVAGNLSADAMTLVSAGNLTLNNGVTLTANAAGNSLVLASTGGSFINNSGAGALSAASGRWLVYSDSPANTTEGGLTYNKFYNKTYAGDPPASIAAGNTILYSIAPTLTITADDKTKTYGDANPGLTGAITGFIDGDTTGNLTGSASYGTAADAQSHAGTYTITAGQNTLSGLGYQFTTVNGTLTIGKASLTITADDKTKTYGDANPVLTASYTGFVNGDNAASLTTGPTLSTTVTGTSNVGTYTGAITAAGAASSDYNLSYVAGNFGVTPASLSVTADDATRAYGVANPAFTASYSGFVLGQNEGVLGGSLSLSTPATLSSPGGSYTITPAGLTSSNYSITFGDGTLTVLPQPAAPSSNTNDPAPLLNQEQQNTLTVETMLPGTQTDSTRMTQDGNDPVIEPFQLWDVVNLSNELKHALKEQLSQDLQNNPTEIQSHPADALPEEPETSVNGASSDSLPNATGEDENKKSMKKEKPPEPQALGESPEPRTTNPGQILSLNENAFQQKSQRLQANLEHLVNAYLQVA